MSVDPLLVDLFVGDLVPPGKQIGEPDIGKLVAAGRPWCGINLKATQGLYYPNNKSTNPYYRDTWLRKYWPLASSLAGDRLGDDWFVTEYHYADLAQDPVAQARWNVEVIKSVGGFPKGCIAPMVDVEDAGNPANLGAAKVEAWLRAYSGAQYELIGIRPILYGNNYLHENHVNFANCGCLALVVARYASTLPATVYTGIGCPLSKLGEWQYIGTEGPTPVPAGYPVYSPLSSTKTMDIAAVVMNDGQGFDASLAWLRANCVPAENPYAAEAQAAATPHELPTATLLDRKRSTCPEIK